MPILLAAEEVVGYLLSRGIDPGERVSVTELADGVSAAVYLVEGTGGRFVVKQALAQLRVQARWTADPLRSLTEAAALQLVSGLTPGRTPHLLDADPQRCAITMTAAPASMLNLRRRLLDDPGLDPGLVLGWFATTGEVLGTWHRETWHRPEVAERFGDDAAFEDLRVAPFYRAVQRVHPGLAPVLARCIEEVVTTRECLVHGDYSPKNVLANGEDLWVLDFEVARFGAAVFDLAFLGHHLLLKALARPASAALFRGAFEAFEAGYRREHPEAADPPTLGHHLAALLLARVDGVSPAGYLTDDQRALARAVALDALASPDLTPAALWDRVPDPTRSDAHAH